MLNGIDPIFIINLYTREAQDEAKETGIAEANEKSSRQRTLDLPIPIYLDEKISQLIVNSESKVVEVLTTNESSDDPDVDVQTTQKTLSNRLTIELSGSQKSLILNTLLGFFEQIYKKVSTNDYDISYLNRSATVLNGKITELSIDQGSDDDLLRIRITLEKGNNESTQGSASGLPEVQQDEDTISIESGAIGNIPAN